MGLTIAVGSLVAFHVLTLRLLWSMWVHRDRRAVRLGDLLAIVGCLVAIGLIYGLVWHS